jgi:hypothetical protein
MKTDKFIKGLLVIISLLLVFNLFKAKLSSDEAKTSASVPLFFQVGNSYYCESALPQSDFQVTDIDQSNGWIKTTEGYWLNTGQFYRCSEVNPSSR